MVDRGDLRGVLGEATKFSGGEAAPSELSAGAPGEYVAAGNYYLPGNRIDFRAMWRDVVASRYGEMDVGGSEMSGSQWSEKWSKTTLLSYVAAEALATARSLLGLGKPDSPSVSHDGIHHDGGMG